jgi:shikimate kinase
MIIFLIGFMGSGKSTTGKQLAKRLGYSFLDTDKLIVEQLGISINEIFNRLGEKTFRENETRLLNELISKDNIVVSTGGGMPCHGNNMDIINRHGLSVYLKQSSQALYDRLFSGKENRPLIKDMSETELMAFIEEKLSEREPYYNKALHIVSGLNVRLDELVKLLRN